jgi:SAM-dependent methyltransferase
MTANVYDQVHYPITSFPETHPRRLQSIAHLFGFESPPPATCRVLELGCAVGGNIVPMAYELPLATCVGIDLSGPQIDQAKQFAAGVGAQNVSLRATSIMDVTPEWGQFDYIIAHGVLSWVPPEVQEKTIQICADLLSPKGIAYVSFNTFPGWHVRMWVREAMLFHVKHIESPIEQARAARDFIGALSQSPFASGDKSPLLKGEVHYMHDKPESYILHDYLEPVNQPFYFQDFAARCAARGLQYLGDAQQNGTVAEEHWPPFKQWIDEAGDDIIRQEQYADFARNRMFRRSLICRGDVALDRKNLFTRFQEMHATAFFRMWAEGGGMTRFEHTRGGRLITGSALVRDALSGIARRFPQTIPVAELLASAGPDRDAVARELLNCWMNGMLELYVEPRSFLSPGEKPRASAVARYLASGGQSPINLRHETIRGDDLQRKLLPLMDGTRTRDQLAAECAAPRDDFDRAMQALAFTAMLEA